MMLTVRRPFPEASAPSSRSIVAIWRASWGGQVSPIRTAISSAIRWSIGAIAAAKAVVSMPSA